MRTNFMASIKHVSAIGIYYSSSFFFALNFIYAEFGIKCIQANQSEIHIFKCDQINERAREKRIAFAQSTAH